MSGPDLTISCDDCTMQRTSACEDCVVTFLCDSGHDEHHDGVIIDADEARAVRLLSRAGLAPALRHSRWTA